MLLDTEHKQTYRVDNPWSTVPGRGINSGPHVEKEDGSNTATSQSLLRMLGRFDDVDVSTNNPHANRTGDTTNEQQLPSSKLVNKEK